MDFLGSEASGFTIQDMIECDMNSEFSDHLAELNYPRVSSPNLSVNTSDCGIQHNGMGMGMDLGFGLLNDSKGLHDNSWLQPAVNVNEIQGLVPVENTDPNLLVNPKTGLPTSPIAKSSPVSLSEPSVVKDAVLSSTESASPTIQFIASPVPASSSIATTSQQAISVQPATVTYMTTPLSSSTPSTLKNIQNNTHSSISSVTTYHQTLTQHLLSSNNNHKITGKSRLEERTYPKPVYSYSCLIAMALKNSETGALPVSEIYSFMTENFPYFKIAPDGWKNSVRHNLSLNKCFEKIENPKATGNSRKGCLWGLNPLKIDKMDEEITKWRKKDPQSVKKSMARPDKLEILEKGNIGSHSPHHPNNVKGTTGEELSSTVDAVHRLLQQQYQTSPASSSSSSSSSSSISSPSSSSSSSDAGSAPATPTKPQAPPTHAPPPHVSLIEIRPVGGGDAKSTIRALKLETTGGVTGVTQQQLLQARHRLQHSTTTSSMIKGEFITIKNEPDVVVKDEPEEEEDEEEDMEGLELHDPSLADISLQVGGGIWDHDLSNEGITLDDLPINSSNFNFSFGTNSLTSSPATVQSVTGVGA